MSRSLYTSLVSRVLTAACLALAVMSCGGSQCEGACECTGSECVCPASGDCLIDCVDDCDLQCTGSGNCDFLCGDLCNATCSGSGQCHVSVGDESIVSCTGSGDCDVDCNGDCTVRCPGSAMCMVLCEPGFDCQFSECSGSTQTCPDDVIVCNGSCP